MTESIKGKPVTEDQIAAWVDEAERGYDVEMLRKRGRGRPGRAAQPSRVVAVRFTDDELAIIDAKAASQDKTRSELLREAVLA